jgi:IMP cyclohydrolase
MSTKKLCDLLRQNTYPGRGIMIGISADGQKAIIAYFIMGRSSNSRNRVFYQDGDDMMIKAFDENKVEDPSLIIYAPLRMGGKSVIVTNGDHTDTIVDYIREGKTFADALRSRLYEPDQPNFTPRISGIIDLEQLSYKLGILKRIAPEHPACSRQFFEYQGIAGRGHFIHTYQGDGDPLPAYEGEPRLISLEDAGDLASFSEEIWHSLDADNKISLAVRYINLSDSSYQTRIINRHSLAQEEY